MPKDDEVKGEGNSLDFGARIYDSRVARWLSVDPLASSYPGWPPYVFAMNNPIAFIDPDGRSGENARERFYRQMGAAALRSTKAKGIENKFKVLYVLAQYRAENGFNNSPPNNNPFNIKGSGDAGTKSYQTTEYIDGKKGSYNESFANFSSIDKGFEGYLNLLEHNFPDAFETLKDDSKNLDDFIAGLKNGKLGSYATNPNYDKLLKGVFESVVNDYKKQITSQIDSNNSQISLMKVQMKASHKTVTVK